MDEEGIVITADIANVVVLTVPDPIYIEYIQTEYVVEESTNG